MADTNTNPPVGKSLDEIAAMMAANREEMMGIKSERQENRGGRLTQLGEQDDQNIEDNVDIDSEVDNIEGPEPEDSELGEEIEEAGDEGDATDGEDESGESELEGLEELDFEDTDLVEIEGVDEPISFGDLKEAYTADKTIVATLQETKAFNQEASQARAKSQEDARLVSEAMTSLVQQVDTLISQPLVELPNEALKTSNPSEYIRQGELYQLDQKRINDSRATVTTALSDFTNQQKEFKDTRRAHELGLLANVIPDLKVEGKREAVSQDIVEAAKFYGFSKEEVTEAIDHRVYQMAYDAAQYHKIMANQNNLENKGGNREQDARDKLNKQPRVLRARGTSARKLSTTSAKRIKVARAKAKASGKPADVAEFMAQKRQQ